VEGGPEERGNLSVDALACPVCGRGSFPEARCPQCGTDLSPVRRVRTLIEEARGLTDAYPDGTLTIDRPHCRMRYRRGDRLGHGAVIEIRAGEVARCHIPARRAATEASTVSHVLAQERFAGVEPPPRASWIRMVLVELERMAWHLRWLAATGGHTGSLSVLQLGCDAASAVDGLRRSMGTTIVPGGVTQDLPASAAREVPATLDRVSGVLDWMELATARPHWQRLAVGLGVVTVADCDAAEWTGPVRRAAGDGLDVRRTLPYLCYEQVDWVVARADTADLKGRAAERIAEARTAAVIIIDAFQQLPPGAHRTAAPRAGRSDAVGIAVEGPEGEVTREGRPAGVILGRPAAEALAIALDVV
jgi:hypothetical protein